MGTVQKENTGPLDSALLRFLNTMELLKERCRQITPDDILLCPRVSVSLNHHQRNFLQLMRTQRPTTAQHTESERLYNTRSSVGCLHLTTPSGFKELCGKGKIGRASEGGRHPWNSVLWIQQDCHTETMAACTASTRVQARWGSGTEMEKWT